METIKFGFKDCLHRLIYKLTSQKLIGFIFASIAIFIVCQFAAHAKAFSVSVAIAGIKAIRDVAIALLVMRGSQSIATQITEAKNGGPK